MVKGVKDKALTQALTKPLHNVATQYDYATP
jgi:hypothetical protein